MGKYKQWLMKQFLKDSLEPEEIQGVSIEHSKNNSESKQ
jgi:hypothetical protein